MHMAMLPYRLFVSAWFVRIMVFCLVFQTVERIAEFPAGADGAVSAVEVSGDKYDKNNRCGKHVR